MAEGDEASIMRQQNRDIFMEVAMRKTFFVIAHGQYNPKFEKIKFKSQRKAVWALGPTKIKIDSLVCSRISKAEYLGDFITSTGSGAAIKTIAEDGNGDGTDQAIFRLGENQFIYGTIPNVYTTVQPDISDEESNSFFRARDLVSILNDIIYNNVEIKYEGSGGGATKKPCLYTPRQLVPNISVSTNFENPGEEGAIGIHYCPLLALGADATQTGTIPIKSFKQPTDVETINRFLQRARHTSRASTAKTYFPIINMVIPLEKLCDILIPSTKENGYRGGLIILPLCFPIRPEIPICGESLVVPVSFRANSGASEVAPKAASKVAPKAASKVATDPNIAIYEKVTNKIEDLQKKSNDDFKENYYDEEIDAASAARASDEMVKPKSWSVVAPEIEDDDYGASVRFNWNDYNRMIETRDVRQLKKFRKIFGIVEIMMDVYKIIYPEDEAEDDDDDDDEDEDDDDDDDEDEDDRARRDLLHTVKTY